MSNYKFETLQVHVGQEQPDPATDARAVPIYQTTSYVFHNSAHAAARFGLADPGNIYGRLTNSTEDVLEKRVAALEGGSSALALASGAAAITYTIQALAANGGHIVAQKTIYGGTSNLLEHTLPQYGIRTTFVDAHDLADPCPAALLLEEEPEAEKKLPPKQRAALPAARRRARERLKEPEAATVKAFTEKLQRSWTEPRDRMRRLA